MSGFPFKLGIFADEKTTFRAPPPLGAPHFQPQLVETALSIVLLSVLQTMTNLKDKIWDVKWFDLASFLLKVLRQGACGDDDQVHSEARGRRKL